MQAIKAIYDGVTFVPKEPIPVQGVYEVIITFVEQIAHSKQADFDETVKDDMEFWREFDRLAADSRDEEPENRIEILRKFIEGLLFEETDGRRLRFNYLSHMNSVSQFCAMIALKRGENAELLTMAGLLHDYYTYKNLDHTDHAKKGAVLAREVLGELKITAAEETDLICSAIHNHSTKERTHSAFDEVLVDADVLQHFLFNITTSGFEHEKTRLRELLKEFGIR